MWTSPWFRVLSSPPGIAARTSLSRFRARKYRFAPASWLIPSTSAVSARLSCSKCRSASTSRSIGSSVLSASWTRSSRSARWAAWVGEVCRPRSIEARAAELASGRASR